MDSPQIQQQVRTGLAQSHQFFVKQGMVRAASAEKTSDERIMLQLAKMKQSLATKYPSDDEVK